MPSGNATRQSRGDERPLLCCARLPSPHSTAPPWQRRAATLALVFVAAKLAVVALRLFDGGARGLASPWAPLALLWEDALVLAVVVPLDAWLTTRFPRSSRGAWLVVAAAVFYVAGNVPVTRVMSTPLTFGLLRAAGGALSDSIKLYVTLTNVASVVFVVAVGCVAPFVVRRPIAPRAMWLATAAVALIGITGSRVGARVDTLGTHRNALFALVWSTADRYLSPPPPHRRDSAVEPIGAALDLSQLSGAARGRNVVWVVLESTGAKYLRPWGARGDDAMPTLTSLAERSVLFPSAYAVYPESIKGFFSEICAAPPAPNTGAELHDERHVACGALPEVLRAQGYATGLFHSGRFAYLSMQDVVNDRGFEVAEDAEVIGGRFSSSFGTDDASTVARTLAWIDGVPRDRPFFAMYMPIAGHHPYRTPGDARRPFPEAPELSAYRNDLFVSDQALTTLVDGLKRRGTWERTLLVISGDHGQAFFQHEGNFGHAMFVYEENLHVPLLIVAPGLVSAQLRAPQLATIPDIAPTVLALLGVKAPARWRGESLLEGRPRVARFFTDPTGLLLGLRNGPWKLIHDAETGRTRLFDLSRDPGETTPMNDPERQALYLRDARAWTDAQRAAIRGEGAR